MHFSYENGHEILKGVNFTVPSGAMYAIVGTSGAGKSTIIGMIPRLYDVSRGSVKIAGTDVRDFSLAYLRQNIGIVTQDTYLFNGTILENLLYAKPDATREEVENACKAANIYDFILSLPKKFNTVVGNRGLKLSGGEKQRVSIARVILKEPQNTYFGRGYILARFGIGKPYTVGALGCNGGQNKPCYSTQVINSNSSGQNYGNRKRGYYRQRLALGAARKKRKIPSALRNAV